MEEKTYQLQYVEERFKSQSVAIKQLEKDHEALKKDHELLRANHQATLQALSDLMVQYKAEMKRNAQLSAYVDKLLVTHSSFEVSSRPPWGVF